MYTDAHHSSFEGFLCKNAEGHWVLCSAPNLKSCCIHTHQLVALDGDFSRYTQDKAVIAEGIYTHGRLYNVHIQEKNGSFPYGLLGLSIIGTLCAAYLLHAIRTMRWKHKSDR